MNKQRLEYLLLQYFEKRATQAERNELAEYLDQEEWLECVNRWMNERYLEEKSSISPIETLKEQIFKNILTDVQSNDDRQTSSTLSRRLRQFYIPQIAAACAVIILALSAYYLVTKNATNDDQSVVKNNVIPGANAAVLTLANGEKITLDQSSGGVIEQNTGIILSTSDSGEVVYKVASNLDAMHTLETPKGGNYQITLSDGTKVWLNAESKLVFPTNFSGKTRAVEAYGEVYFEVAKDKSRPFIVGLENQTQINVLGTAFNVNTYPENKAIATTLVHGSVSVVMPNAAKTIKPGEQLNIEKSTGRYRVDTDVDINTVIAWKAGNFSDGSTYLIDLMHNVKRWYNVDVVFIDKINPQFVAKFPKNIPLSELLDLLELTKKVAFDFDGKTIKIRRYMEKT